MSKNRITSIAPTTKDWYKQEIAKAYDNLKASKHAYYDAVKTYNQEMAKVFASAYNINLKENLANRVKLTQAYKKQYKELCDRFLRLGKRYTEMLNYRHLLDELIEERKKEYGKLGKQSD